MKKVPHTKDGKVSLTATTEETEIAAEAENGEPFCPHKDLNLPKSYDEVVSRMKRLQGSREGSDLN